MSKRSYKDEHVVYFFDTWPAEPVFHGASHESTPDLEYPEDGVERISRDLTVCGQELSALIHYEGGPPYRHRLRDNVSAYLPLRHALRFGRPCRRCFSDADE